MRIYSSQGKKRKKKNSLFNSVNIINPFKLINTDNLIGECERESIICWLPRSGLMEAYPVCGIR
jgi:hypothetical protein